jgi:hypothetical protein
MVNWPEKNGCSGKQIKGLKRAFVVSSRKERPDNHPAMRVRNCVVVAFPT